MTLFQRLLELRKTKFRFLPFLVLLVALSFGVRLGEFVYGLDSVGEAFAAAKQESEKDTKEEKKKDKDKGKGKDKSGKDKKDSAKEDNKGDKKDKGEGEESDSKAKLKKPFENKKWRDATEADIEYSPAQLKLFEDLTKRRKDLETKERELIMREALLQAAEQELSQKFRELNTLRSEIESLLEKQSKEEEDRFASLVKIYEGMKAKDAARIFNTLDMNVLLSVLVRMSERKSAPIIAAMNDERARTVTILLAEQKQLSNIPDTFE